MQRREGKITIHLKIQGLEGTNTLQIQTMIDVIDVSHLYIICQSQVMLHLDLKLRFGEIHLQYLTRRVLFGYILNISRLCVVPFIWLKSRVSMIFQTRSQRIGLSSSVRINHYSLSEKKYI